MSKEHEQRARAKNISKEEEEQKQNYSLKNNQVHFYYVHRKNNLLFNNVNNKYPKSNSYCSVCTNGLSMISLPLTGDMVMRLVHLTTTNPSCLVLSVNLSSSSGSRINLVSKCYI